MYREVVEKRCDRESTRKTSVTCDPTSVPTEAVRAGVACAWPVRRTRPRGMTIKVGA